MADIIDVLHHLVKHSPGLSETNRDEFHAAIDRTIINKTPTETKQESKPATPETKQVPPQE